MDLLTELNRFYDLDTEQEKKLKQDVLAFAMTDMPGFMQAIIPIRKVALTKEGDADMSMVYEALAPEAEHFADFFLSEIKTTISQAKATADRNHKKYLLDDLGLITDIDKDKISYRKRIVALLQPTLTDEDALVRSIGLDLISEFVNASDLSAVGHMRDLLKDQNWRVRNKAFADLGYADLLQPGESLSLLDKIRVKLFSPKIV